MNLSQFAFLADENIHPAVAEYLRQGGFDVATVQERALLGATDAEIIQAAFKTSRVVITHDRDFGALAVVGGNPSSASSTFVPGTSGRTSPSLP